MPILHWIGIMVAAGSIVFSLVIGYVLHSLGGIEENPEERD